MDDRPTTTGPAVGVQRVARAPGRACVAGSRVGRSGRSRAGLLTVPVLAAALAACQPTAGSGSSPPTAARGTMATTGSGRALTAADGWLRDGQSLSPFADVPAITRLRPALRRAVQHAAHAATHAGIRLRVTSGWRSAAYQQALFDAAVVERGSADAASGYVLSPGRSHHVTGRAVDIGPAAAMSWMAQHGSDDGLCQTYGNEKWHFELTVAPGGRCPAPMIDASAG